MQKYLAQAAIIGVSLLIAAILVVVGVGFFGAAVYFALRQVLEAPMAAFATGACGLVLAVVIVLLGQLVGRLVRTSMRRKQARPSGPAPAGLRGFASDLGVLAGKEIAALARGHVHGTLAASLIAGFAVGASPGLRRLLRDLLEI